VKSILQHVAPGQVLLSSAMAPMVQQLPNVSLRETGNGSWRELLWRSPELAWSYSGDEQTLLGLIRGLGREDPCPTAPPVFGVTTTAAIEEDATEDPEPEGPISSRPERGMWAAKEKKKWWIGGAAAAVVLLAAGLVILGMVSGKPDKTSGQVPDRAPKSTGTVSPPNPPAGEDAADAKKAMEPKVVPPPPKPRPAKPAEPRVEAKTEPPLPKGQCDLTEGEIPRSLDRANSLMYAGRLPEAQAVFQKLLGCGSAHDKAAAGLQQVKQRIAAQSP
jgi:hypothetical protein